MGRGLTIRWGAVASLLVLILAVGGLPVTGQPLRKVIFTTDFGFNGRHAYYYVALDRGYYRAAGLDVEIVRGAGSADAIKQVAAGRALVGFADAGTLILARGNDGVPVQLLAVVYARPPHAIYALWESGIRLPRDLEGRTVADTAGSAVPALFPVYAKWARINKDAVRWVFTDSAALPGLLATGRVDAVGQFIVGEPLLRKRVAPRELVRLAYADVGLDYYGNGLIAAEETIRRQPDVLRAFVRATIRGMEDAFRDPAEAGRIINRYHPQIEPDIGQGETEAVRELAITPLTQQRGLGYVDRLRVWRTLQVITDVFTLRMPVRVEDIYAPGFTGRP